jgi:hypothetical protein
LEVTRAAIVGYQEENPVVTKADSRISQIHDPEAPTISISTISNTLDGELFTTENAIYVLLEILKPG